MKSILTMCIIATLLCGCSEVRRLPQWGQDAHETENRNKSG